ncbi:hypothetical protein [Dictyobacter arantiisoli]|uniref:UvrD-like helicase C-terminal domain-containing protein n=1 Tax=Dictyobacter arantiisoli TaxID=2014874 RepID=A0A5A5TL78_9CHLR|nr:hypothetical protein [Dictyobacter arantiisoli]GCF11823.1 hypothetical protein KDI_53870 [Dictyobacter arantiisoli]
MGTLQQELQALSDGPITLLGKQEDKLEQVRIVLNKFSSRTIQQTLDTIKSSGSFLNQHQQHTELILATITYAKSQEFATVFVLGVEKVWGKKLYVSASRAKQRLFFVGDRESFAKPREKELLQAPQNLYVEIETQNTIDL